MALVAVYYSMAGRSRPRGLLSIRSFSDEETVELRAQLLKNTVKELTSLAKSVSVKLAGSTRR